MQQKHLCTFENWNRWTSWGPSFSLCLAVSDNLGAFKTTVSGGSTEMQSCGLTNKQTKNKLKHFSYICLGCSIHASN